MAIWELPSLFKSSRVLQDLSILLQVLHSYSPWAVNENGLSLHYTNATRLLVCNCFFSENGKLNSKTYVLMQICFFDNKTNFCCFRRSSWLKEWLRSGLSIKWHVPMSLLKCRELRIPHFDVFTGLFSSDWKRPLITVHIRLIFNKLLHGFWLLIPCMGYIYHFWLFLILVKFARHIWEHIVLNWDYAMPLGKRIDFLDIWWIELRQSQNMCDYFQPFWHLQLLMSFTWANCAFFFL